MQIEVLKGPWRWQNPLLEICELTVSAWPSREPATDAARQMSDAFKAISEISTLTWQMHLRSGSGILT